MEDPLTALKKLGDDVNECINSGGIHCVNINNYRIIEKSLKALEIIKREPSVAIEIITTYDSWEEYNSDYPLIWHVIRTKKEFNLLKEMLL